MEPNDFHDLLLIGFDKIGLNDTKHFNRMVHFFLYDYKFERIWKLIQNYNSLVQTEMGSAYGGQWKPKKPEDERFFEKPGEIKTTFKNGYRIDTKIG